MRSLGRLKRTGTLLVVAILAATSLWASEPLLVKDIQPGSGGSDIGELTSVGGQVFFRAFDSAEGWELWSSDGTPAGTKIVGRLTPGDRSSFPNGLAEMGGALYFAAQPVGGFTIYKTDGTESK